MEETQDTTQEGAPEVPVTDSEWKKRYNGLNTKYDQERQKWSASSAKADSIIADLTGRSKDLESSLKDWEKRHTDLETQFKATLEGKAGAETKAATLEKALARQQLFFDEEFSALIPLEKKGLLRKDLEGEDLVAHLREFRSTVTGIQDSALKEKLAGSVPATGAANRSEGTLDEASLWKQLQAAQEKRDWAEVDRLNAQWIELKSK